MPGQLDGLETISYFSTKDVDEYRSLSSGEGRSLVPCHKVLFSSLTH